MSFLSLSSDTEVFKNEKKIILLGPWCINDEKLIKEYDYELLPYHWVNNEKFQSDLKFLFKLYKDLIPEISRVLNNKNKTSFSNRYWEILIGPWLWSFVQILFDRYSSLKIATNKYSNLETEITDDIYSPKSFKEYEELIHDDDYNFIIFSKIIKTLKLPIKIRNKKRNISRVKTKVLIKKPYISFKQKLRNIYKKIYTIIFNILFPNNNYFLNINFPIGHIKKAQLYKLLGHNKHLLNLVSPQIIDQFNSEYHLSIKSNYLNKKYEKNEFVRLFLEVALTFMPTEFNENFKFSRDHYIKSLPKKYPKILGIRCPVEVNPIIRFWTAELSENGAKIISCQEGGGDGFKTINKIDEEFRFRLCDIFLTWGWKSENKKIRDFYVTKDFPRKYNYNKNGEIVMLGASCRKYYLSSTSGQLPSYNETLIKYNTDLIGKLDNNIYNKLIYRFHWNMGYNEQHKIRKLFPNLKFSLREDTSHFYELLFKSSLIIISTDYTTNKQCFLLNHPTLLLWDQNYFKIRPEAQKYYDQLFEAEILFFSAELCANKVNTIAKDPFSWWNSEQVQKAKNNYCEYLCRDNQNLSLELSKLIKGIL
ncbi:MAG: hypothetical protein CFH18_00076 [Alphaproteobacteria bacterium MarineAlpha5_Bin8]|nr:MAG: hypothetical protein CFH18_00076 [Alphaproteobacteria bacterium MarineAlpha5_Bin8]PPR53885.1 MAG: hypothetical protein CFH16_00760 [Alphaproteobacteria bacterium MarineAlpha5_Bin6]|tara:strand:- start:225 stop:1997 length:1773 start_codon:yes stop_codon:yes gene_type:complete